MTQGSVPTALLYSECCAPGDIMHYWRPRGGGGGGGCCRLLARGGGVPSGKEGRGGALYDMNGFTTTPGICPCVFEFSLTR